MEFEFFICIFVLLNYKLMNIEEILKPILDNFNIDSYDFKQRNKIGNLIIFLNEEWNPNHIKNESLVEAVKALPIIHNLQYACMSMGKRIENKNRYTFSFSLKKEFYNGNFNLNDHHGYLLKLIQSKGIKTKEELYKVTIGMIKNMSDFTHTLKFKEKGKYRGIKLNYIQNLYQAGFIESLAMQISYSNDNLVLFKTKFGQSFHLRKDDCWFVPLNDLELLPILYMKREIDVDNIDTEFLNYIPVLRRMDDEFMLKNAELI